MLSSIDIKINMEVSLPGGKMTPGDQRDAVLKKLGTFCVRYSLKNLEANWTFRMVSLGKEVLHTWLDIWQVKCTVDPLSFLGNWKRLSFVLLWISMRGLLKRQGPYGRERIASNRKSKRPDEPNWETQMRNTALSSSEHRRQSLSLGEAEHLRTKCTGCYKDSSSASGAKHLACPQVGRGTAAARCRSRIYFFGSICVYVK